MQLISNITFPAALIYSALQCQEGTQHLLVRQKISIQRRYTRKIFFRMIYFKTTSNPISAFLIEGHTVTSDIETSIRHWSREGGTLTRPLQAEHPSWQTIEEAITPPHACTTKTLTEHIESGRKPLHLLKMYKGLCLSRSCGRGQRMLRYLNYTEINNSEIISSVVC